MCKEIKWEEGGTATIGDDDSGLNGGSIRMPEHCVKEVCVRVCVSVCV